MSVEINTLMALAVSLIALFYLKQVDPKRRRVYRLPKMTRGEKKYTRIAWLFSLIPGLVLLVMQDYSEFIMWFAAYSLLGWLVALPKPKKKLVS